MSSLPDLDCLTGRLSPLGKSANGMKRRHDENELVYLLQRYYRTDLLNAAFIQELCLVNEVMIDLEKEALEPVFVLEKENDTPFSKFCSKDQ